MARVAVLHNTLDFRGGADAVCLEACAALAGDHEVTLFTVSTTRPADLAETFGRPVDVSVRTPPGGEIAARALSGVAPWLGPQLPMRSALLWAWFRRHAPAFDLAVSTANEFALPIPSVQYIHYPQFNRHHLRDPESPPGRLDHLWSRLAGPEPRGPPAGATLLSNSAWTAGVVADIYGTRPTVVHPPVDPPTDPRPWAEREDGIVAVGRLAPDNRTLDAVRIVDRLRDRGHDLHLHLVGTAAPAYRSYVERIERAARTRAYVALERDVGRDRLEQLLRSHRYGLNTKPVEHFGMALAECVAAGMVAFAPDGGGQRDVLDDRADRLYGSIDEAVRLIARAVESDARPPLQRDRFRADRFHDTIREHVADAL